jgi:hypothetical protein
MYKFDIFTRYCLVQYRPSGPLPGASVLVKGTNGAQTDLDGKFTIKLSSNAVLVLVT